MKVGTLVKLKTEESDKGYMLGVIVSMYEGTSNISIADIYLFESKLRILAWAKDLEVLSET
tara:strand:- start:1839 stop:2021 length:183 start_codon:yes stop_codon:yes gene_type:complete